MCPAVSSLMLPHNKDIKLVVEITVTPFKGLDAPRVIGEGHRVNKEPRPMESKFKVASPTVPCGPVQQSQLQEWVVPDIPSPSGWSQSWLKLWGGHISAVRQEVLSSYFLSFSSRNSAIRTTLATLHWRQCWSVCCKRNILLWASLGVLCHPEGALGHCITPSFTQQRDLKVSQHVSNPAKVQLIFPNSQHTWRLPDLQKWLAASEAVQWNWQMPG